jgi:hypothetical protein
LPFSVNALNTVPHESELYRKCLHQNIKLNILVNIHVIPTKEGGQTQEHDVSRVAVFDMGHRAVCMMDTISKKVAAIIL